MALLCRRQDAGQIVFDLDVVLVGDHGDMQTDQSLQFAKGQAEGVGLRGIVELEVAGVRPGSVDEGSESRAHRAQTLGERVAGLGIAQGGSRKVSSASSAARIGVPAAIRPISGTSASPRPGKRAGATAVRGRLALRLR